MKAVVLVTSLLLLAGCSAFDRLGCRQPTCDRPTSNDREMVIWWPAQMRDGLGKEGESVDFTRVPLED